MIALQDIRSLTDFQRNTKEHLKRLKNTGRPEILTVNGEAELVVQSAASYQKLLDAADLSTSVTILKARLASIARGERGIPLKKFDAAMRREHAIPRQP